MVNIENQVISKLQKDLALLYPGIKVVATYNVNELSHIKLPLVTFETTNNIEDIDTYDGVENYSQITFELQVYTDGDSKKELNNKICSSIDTILNNYYGMRRIICTVLPNIENNTICRKILEYDGLVDNVNLKIYRR